jgi:hypothetical protein
MPRAALLPLKHCFQRNTNKSGELPQALYLALNLLFSVAHDHDAPRSPHRADGVKHSLKQGVPTHPVKHLGQGRTHPGSLPCPEHYDLKLTRHRLT